MSNGPRKSTASPPATNLHLDPILLTPLADGQIYLEVHRDIYKQGVDMLQSVHGNAAMRGISSFLDWQQIREVIRTQEGVAWEVAVQLSLQTR
ncbi:MAG: hypothetical protein HYZ81_23795 [Nitrospinae bacterium]|nr:hypothetical protein [Nitrospinota bacterium]